jgi:hypothetical protein
MQWPQRESVAVELLQQVNFQSMNIGCKKYWQTLPGIGRPKT